MKQHGLSKFLSLILVMFLCFTMLPSTPILKNTYTTYASTGGFGDDNNGIGGDNTTSGNNTGVWNTALSGLNLKDNSNNSVDLLTRGSYTGEDDSYFYMYYLSKKKTSNTYYRTLGFLATTKSINKNSEDSNSISKSLFLTESGFSETLLFNALADNGISGSDKPSPIIYPVEKQDLTSNATVVDKNGIECVATLLKFSKQELYNTLEKNGTLSDFNWVTTTDKDGNTIFKANVYLQGITGIYINGKLDNNIYTYLPKLQSDMQKLGFSSESISDVASYYNFNMYLKKASNSITYVDADTLDVLSYIDISKSTDTISDLLNFKWEKSGNLMFNGSDKRYHIVAGTMLPKGYYTETHSSSQFVTKVVAKAIQNKSKYPYGIFDMNVFNSLTKSFFSLNEVKSFSVESSGTNYTVNKNIVPSGELVTNYGYIPSVLSDNGSITFSSSGGSGTGNDNSQISEFKGYQMYVFVSTEDASTGNDVVMYDAATGNKLKIDSVDYDVQLKTVQDTYKNYLESTPSSDGGWLNKRGNFVTDSNWSSSDYTEKIPITYTFPSTLPTLTNSYVSYDGMDHRDNTTLIVDIPQTKSDVISGKPVLTNGAEQTTRTVNTGAYILVSKHVKKNYQVDYVKIELVKPQSTIYRAAYSDNAPIDVLYYSNENGDLISRDKAYNTSKYSSKDMFKLGDLVYYAKNISYRTNTSPETDISKTKNNLPIMNSSDLGVTSGNTINIPANVVSGGNYIIRVECDLKPDTTGKSDADFVIPAQTLGKQFTYKETLEAKTEEAVVPGSYSHEYYDYWDYDTDSSVYSTCTVTYSHSYGLNSFDWDNTLKNILTPQNYLFTNLGGLTKINSLQASGDSHTISTDATLDFFSHRVDVDGVSPVLAKYMHNDNTAALSFMNSHSMQSLATESLLPNSKYSAQGGSSTGYLNFTSGNKTQHGRLLTETESHDSCGDPDSTVDRFINTSEYTSKRVGIKVVAEPSIVASAKAVAGDLTKTIGTSLNSIQTYIQTTENAISFYPTYKMFIGGNNAWVLGKLERKLKAVNVAQVELVTNTPVVSLDSTWSRDKEDSGKLVMKGGYQYAINQNTPAEFKVTTYIVVPKEGWVDDSYNVRAELLAKHQVLVNSIAKETNFKYVSNLPEAYSESAPSQFKISNPYKQSGDNVSKSRIAQPAVNITKGTTNQSTMSLESLDGLYTDVNNVERLKGQLETKDWYSERFDGFEVIKQVTTIKVQAGRVTATNFVRNGGTSYNDLAHQVLNMPSAFYCFELALYQPKATFMGKEISILSLTKPYTFNVRGTVYDDRS